MSVSVANALVLSLEVALVATLLGAPVAVALGYLLARRDFPGKSLVSAAVLLPVVLPPVVTGLLLLSLVGRTTPLGGFLARIGLPLSFSFGGAVLAALVVGLPFFVMMARTAFESVDPRYEEVAASLGTKPFATFWRVTMPLALPGLLGGAVLAFARALGEFGATAVLAGSIEGETRTLSLAVYALLDVPGGEARTVPLVLASALCSLGALVAYEALARLGKRRLEVHDGR